MLLATTTTFLCVLIGQSYAARSHQLSSQSKALHSSERSHHHHSRYPIHYEPLPIHSNETVKNKHVTRRKEQVNLGKLHWSVPSRGINEAPSNSALPGSLRSRRMKRHRRVARRNESVNLGELHWSVPSRGRPDEEAPSNSSLPGLPRSRRMKRHRRVKFAARKKELQQLPPATPAVTAGRVGSVAGAAEEAEDVVPTPLLVASTTTNETESKTAAAVTQAGEPLGNETIVSKGKQQANEHSNASTSSNETLEVGVGEGENNATGPGEEAEAAAGANVTSVETKSAKGKKKKGKAKHVTTTVPSGQPDGESTGEAENGEISFASEKPSNKKTNSFGFPIEDIPVNGVLEDQNNTTGPSQMPQFGTQLETNETALHLETTTLTHEPKSPTLLIVAAVVVSLVGVVAILVIGMVLYRYRAEIFGKKKEAPKPPTETAPLRTDKKPSDKGLKKTKDVASNVGLVLKNDAAKPGAPPRPGGPPGPGGQPPMPGTGPVPPGTGPVPPGGAAAAAGAAPGAAPGATPGAPKPLSAFGAPTKPGITPSAPMGAAGAAPSHALKPDGTPIGAHPAVPASTAAPSMVTTAPATSATSATSAASSAQSDISGSASAGASSASSMSSAKP